MKVFVLFLLSNSLLGLISFEELFHLPVDGFVDDVLEMHYAGPLYEDEFDEKQTSTSYKRYIK